jgi:hypothetical protein
MTPVVLALLLLAPMQQAPAPEAGSEAPAEQDASEARVIEMLSRIVAAEAAWGRENGGQRASLLDLILARRIPATLGDGVAAGYRFKLKLGQRQRTFEITATPVAYGPGTARSFFADRKGVRGEDAGGEAASSKAPLLAEADK